MVAYTRSEAKQWARQHMVKSTNAVPTPFKADFSLDLPTLASHVDRWAQDGLHGLMTGGNTAEAWNMTPTEWWQYSETVAQANRGRMLLTSVILDPSPFTVLEKAHRLAELGFDLIEVINPVIQLRSDSDLFDFYKYLNDHSPLGIVLYNTPTAGVTLNHGLINRLADLEMVVGIKNGLLNPADSIALRKQCGDRIVVTEPMESFYLWDAIVHGGQCLFGTCEYVMFGRKRETLVKYMALADAGKFDQALPLYRELEPLRDLMNNAFVWNIVRKNQYSLAPIKYWFELLGFRMGPCRPPLPAFADEEMKTAIRDTLISTGVIDANQAAA
ncbi:MAG: dihydrodipicolinate synthase family protein [Immundisolibacter sp.]|uniref:dihydrodipicolinate synthase family protein n=2 Tax=Immundisolibacter sp. TaxID=1934948 RepID=UPI003567923B